MPALSTAFSDEAASSSSEGLETIFDAQRAQRAADAEIASAAAAAAEAAKADAADSVDEGAPSEVQTKLFHSPVAWLLEYPCFMGPAQKTEASALTFFGDHMPRDQLVVHASIPAH